MDEIFYGMDRRLKNPMKDSIMMSSLLSAMNKAHQNLQSKQGIIGRLIEISKFYELAVMQLEGCLKIVEEETDSENWFLEIGHEEVLSDLYMIRNRLKQRLQDTDNTISDMDKALAGRLENELNLRQILEIKEKELISLRDEFDELQRENVPRDDTIRQGNDPSEGNLSELKNCIDQKLCQSEEKLEKNLNIETPQVEETSSDMDIHKLKDTLDQAGTKMQNAILLSDIELTDQELRWSIEKDIISLLTDGFLKDMREEFQTKLRESERNFSVLSEHWLNSMNEIRSLRGELDTFIHEREFSPRARKYVSLDDNNQVDADHNSVKDERMNHIEEGVEGDRSHYVAKMIKSHETLIRQKSDELKWIKGELLSEKGFRRDKDHGSPKANKLQEVIVRLDNIIHANTYVGETVCRSGNFQYKGNSLEQNVLTASKTGRERTSNIHSRDEDIVGEKTKAKQEIEDSDFHAKKLEETYVVLLRGLRKEFYCQLHDTNIKEGPERNAEDCEIEFRIREAIYSLVLSEMVKYVDCTHYSSPIDPEAKMSDNLETIIEQDVSSVFFRTMFHEWRIGLESCNTENNFKEEIYRIVFEETMKSILHNDVFASSRYQEVSWEALPCFEEIDKVHRLEIEDIKICNRMKEDIYQFTVLEAAKETYALCLRSLNSPAVDKLGSYQDGGEDSFMQKLISALESFGTEENLLKRHKTGLEHEYLDQKVVLEESVVEDESTFTSFSSKFEKTLHQLHKSKMLLSELGNVSWVEVELDMEVDQIAPCKDHSSKEGEQHFFPNKKHNHDNKLTLPKLESLILITFDQELGGFEQSMHDKIANNMLRLEDANNQLEPLRSLADSLGKKETLYRKAFIRRCQDLHKAEAEVDLLGDQVDVLLGLLETIYMTLLQHSPVLEQYFRAWDVLDLIKKELAIGAAPLNRANS